MSLLNDHLVEENKKQNIVTVPCSSIKKRLNSDNLEFSLNNSKQ